MARQAELRKQAAELAKQSITIEANANEEGHLYGSVGAAEIVAALKKNDIHLHADQIRLEGPLKELGLYTVKFRYASEVEGELKVWVVPTVGDRHANVQPGELAESRGRHSRRRIAGGSALATELPLSNSQHDGSSLWPR